MLRLTEVLVRRNNSIQFSSIAIPFDCIAKLAPEGVTSRNR